MQFHCYTDDTQLYLSTKPDSVIPPTFLSECLLRLKFGLPPISFNLTEAFFIASKSTLAKFDNLPLTADGSVVSQSPQVKNLGVFLDNTLSFRSHIYNIT